MNTKNADVKNLHNFFVEQRTCRRKKKHQTNEKQNEIFDENFYFLEFSQLKDLFAKYRRKLDKKIVFSKR